MATSTRSSTRSTSTGSAPAPAPVPVPAPHQPAPAPVPVPVPVLHEGGGGGAGGGGGGGGGGGDGGGGGGGGDGVVDPPGPPPVVFARTPGELEADYILDYSTKEGKNAFKAATKPLSETKYDGKSAGINQFHEKLLRRAQECGWDTGAGDIIHINGINSIKHYGRITADDIRVNASLYVNNNSRQTQNNEQIYRCIMNSITEECTNKIINRPSEYSIIRDRQAFVAAILLHKSLMQKAIVDTRSTSSNFRTNLSSLDSYMPLVNSNISKFNEYVSTCIIGLEARGETSEDLLDNLFKGYKVAADAAFVQYIEQKETDFFDGADLTPDNLMLLAENKYASRVERNTWGGKSEEQKQIIALTTTVTSLKNSLKSKKPNSKEKGKGQGKGKGKGQGKGQGKGKDSGDWTWKNVAPKRGETTKKFRGKTYHWCKFHEAWTLHKSSECKKDPNYNSETGNVEAPAANAQTNNVSFAASVESIMEELEE